MKRYALIILTVLLSTLVLGAADTFQEGFDRANRLFEEEKYQESLQVYLELQEKGSHWRLFYNTGNCYYKLDRFVEAKIYYLRAQRLNPFDPSIRKNIEIVDKQFKDKITAPEPDFIARTVMRFESLVSLNALSIVLLLAILVLNLFIFLLILKGKKRVLIYGVSFSLVIVFVLFGYHFYRVSKQNIRDVGVVIKEDAILRSGPGESNTILFKVNPGLKIKIIDKSKNWLEVSASKEIAGWVKETDVEKI